MKTSKTNYIIIAIIFIVLNLGIFSYMMIEPHWYDENMYVSAGVLIQSHSLYKDFAFLQMPYLPILYGIIFQITGTAYYFLTTELINFFFMGISCLLIFLISLKVAKNTLFALGMLLLFLFNDVTIFVIKYSANTIMPITFSLLGVYLFLIGVLALCVRPIRILVSGIAVAISIGTKLYYAAILPPFLIMALLYPKSLAFRQRIFKIVIPFSIGVIIGLIPVFYYLLRDIEIFLFNNLDYHQLNTVYRKVTGFTLSMSPIGKLNYGLSVLKSPANMALLIGALFLIFVKFSEKQRLHLKTRLSYLVKIEHLFFILLFLLTAIAAFVPTPLWLHYFILPLPYILILIASWYSDLTNLDKRFVNILMVCLILVSFLSSGTSLFKHVSQLPQPGRWSCINVHRVAQQIKNSIGTVDQNQKIATIDPLYALEAGFPIYKELSTGPFIFRLGDLLPETIVKKYSYVSSQNIYDLFEKDPPKAILVDRRKEYIYNAFIKFAEKKNYKKSQEDLYGVVLYISSEK